MAFTDLTEQEQEEYRELFIVIGLTESLGIEQYNEANP